MNAFTQRAFSRNHYNAPVIFACCGTEEYCMGTMCNSSIGGMYFETDRALNPGAGIHIRFVDMAPDPYWPEACDNYLAEVRWCVTKGQAHIPKYGIGVRFIMETCRQCGQKIRHENINCLGLCQGCLKEIESLSDETIRESIENYLLGNVL
ncbi:hypothetical protein DENIS_4596 [Desulfonema ishimotonii]|uniref:PilZ domain-containing protein n=1 Tax=Desulfonema ishimotonii TaxID=45657 RepID=A0A401G2X8_9BACT|nr:PilZ domain-containing protein [Desulfonema ishimotonii]GBC63598.1 hypothetical protein DENIS_4596 [Desulfonema ishimotonii]